MQTIQLQVKDDYVTNVVGLLNSLKDVMIESVEIKEDENLKIDPYFYERREELHQLRDDIRSGKIEMLDFNNSMDELLEELQIENHWDTKI